MSSLDKFFEDENHSSEEEDLKTLSFQERLKLKKSGFSTQEEKLVRVEKLKFQKHSKNKNAPREMSSKVRVPPVRDVTSHLVKRPKPRDPRFEDYATLDKPKASHYSFVTKLREQEIENYRKLLKRDDLDEEQKKEIQRRMSKLITVQTMKKRAVEEAQIRKELEEQESKLIEQGKKPYYYSKGKIKQLVAKKRFLEMKEKGSLEKYLKRKKRKLESKDAKMILTTRAKK